MSNVYLDLYQRIVKEDGRGETIKFSEYLRVGLVTQYEIELLFRAYENSKKFKKLKDLSEFEFPLQHGKRVEEVYLNSQVLSSIGVENLPVQEKEELLATILEALDNPQNKYAVCSSENVYVEKSKVFLSSFYSTHQDAIL